MMGMDRTGTTVVISCFLLMAGWYTYMATFHPPQTPADSPEATETVESAEESTELSDTSLNAPSTGTNRIKELPVDGKVKETDSETVNLANKPPKETTETKASKTAEKTEGAIPVEKVDRKEEKLTLENDLFSVLFTSKGGGISRIHLKEHEAETGVPLTFNRGGSTPIGNLHKWFWDDEQLIYDSMEPSEDGQSITFTRTFPDGLKLERTYTLKSDYQINLTQKVTNNGVGDRALLPVYINMGVASATYYLDYERRYVTLGWLTEEGTFSTALLTSFEDTAFLGMTFWEGSPTLKSPEGEKLRWSSVSTQFFTTIFSPNDGTQILSTYAYREDLPEIGGKSSLVQKGMSAHLIASGGILSPGQALQQSFTIYAGPKEDQRLAKLDNDKREVMNFGWLTFIVRPLLLVLVWVHSMIAPFDWAQFVGPYGLAIVTMTIMVKAVLWMPQTYANKSMRRLQALSKPLKEINKKHKDNPEKLQKEMLALYRDHGVSPIPIGGCLPMLVQFPIFIGFYWMLMSVVELRHEHFLWITDLAQPDTIYTFDFMGMPIPINPMPILMAASMYWSFAIMPQPETTEDNPMQAVMKIMPLMMLFICYNFSSALSLYWTVQSLISILQMYINLKQEPVTLEDLKRDVAKKNARKKEQGPGWMDRIMAAAEEAQKEQAKKQRRK